MASQCPPYFFRLQLPSNPGRTLLAEIDECYDPKHPEGTRLAKTGVGSCDLEGQAVNTDIKEVPMARILIPLTWE